jgi:hydrogenase nickel insertion protein HypA
MHEYSIVQALLGQCEKYAAENEAERITKVEVKIGTMSGVEPHLLQIAFDTFKEKTVCDGAVLAMQVQPLVVRCRSCGSESELDAPHYLCPACGSREVEVIDGEEMYLMRLEME